MAGHYEIQANLGGNTLLPSLKPVISLYTNIEWAFKGVLVQYSGSKVPAPNAQALPRLAAAAE